MIEEITKEIFNKQCEIENRGYVKGIGYAAITNEMQEDIDFLESIKKKLDKYKEQDKTKEEWVKELRENNPYKWAWEELYKLSQNDDGGELTAHDFLCFLEQTMQELETKHGIKEGNNE